MSTRRPIVRFRRFVHRSLVLQVGLLLTFWCAGEILVRVAGQPVPGGVVGMLIVLGLLATGRMSLLSVRHGAEWFLGRMLLFFIPAVLAVLQHPELLGPLGLKILAVVAIGTATVMMVTAITVDVCLRWRIGAAAPRLAAD